MLPLRAAGTRVPSAISWSSTCDSMREDSGQFDGNSAHLVGLVGANDRISAETDLSDIIRHRDGSSDGLLGGFEPVHGHACPGEPHPHHIIELPPPLLVPPGSLCDNNRGPAKAMLCPTEHEALPLGQEKDDLVFHVQLGDVKQTCAVILPLGDRVVADVLSNLGELRGQGRDPVLPRLHVDGDFPVEVCLPIGTAGVVHTDARAVRLEVGLNDDRHTREGEEPVAARVQLDLRAGCG